MAKITDRDKGDRQSLSLSIAGGTWGVISGKLVLQLRFNQKIPPNLRDERGTVSGCAYGSNFGPLEIGEGSIIVVVPITDLSAQPRVKATLEIGGQIVETFKDIPFSPPTNAVSVDLVTNVFEKEQGGVKVRMLAVGVQLTMANQPVTGNPVKVGCQDFFDQDASTDSKGRCEVCFGPVEENRTYEIAVSTPQTGERRQTIKVPKRHPEMEFKVTDFPTEDRTSFKVTCNVWKTETGEAVPDLPVTIRHQGLPISGKTVVDGCVTLGPINFDPNSRLTKYTVFVQGFPPKECNIKKPKNIQAQDQPEGPDKGFRAGFRAEVEKIRGV